jgi:hypothetical protein
MQKRGLMMPEYLKFEHEQDAAWLMALFLAIYGGDPPEREVRLDETEVYLVSALLSYFLESQGLERPSPGVVDERLAAFGIHPKPSDSGDGTEETGGAGGGWDVSFTSSGGIHDQDAPYKEAFNVPVIPIEQAPQKAHISR